MIPKDFKAGLFIGIGEKSCYYTLRQTDLCFVANNGTLGGAVVNGDYQGAVKVSSFHLQNLSTDIDEAFEKATQLAKEYGLPLKTKKDELRQQMVDIRRATEEEINARGAELNRQREKRELEEKERFKEMCEIVDAGVVPCGKFRGVNFSDLPTGYIRWLIVSKHNFEAGTIMRYISDKASMLRPDLIDLPTPDKNLHICFEGTRKEFNVVVISAFSFPSEDYYGNPIYIHVTNMYDKETSANLTVMSSSFSADVGDELTIKGTVKKHGTYKGQAQTFLNRVSVIEKR